MKSKSIQCFPKKSLPAGGIIGLYFSEIDVDQTITIHSDYYKSLKITNNFWPELYVLNANDI